VAKTATCLWCEEEITEVGEQWKHTGKCCQYIFCECHCADCDPEGGYTDGRICIDGEPATPKLETITKKEN